MEDEGTQIAVKKSTRAELKKLGNKGETYDSIVNRLIDSYRSDSE